MGYLEGPRYNKEDYYGTEYWLLSYVALERILIRQGFQYFHRIDDPRERRSILIAGRIPHTIFESSDIILHRGRMKTFLSHTKRYLKTWNIRNMLKAL